MKIQDLPWLELDTKALEEIKGGDFTKLKFDFDLNIDTIDTNINIAYEPESSYVCLDTVIFYKGKIYQDSCHLADETRNLPHNHQDFYPPDDINLHITEELIASIS